MRRTVAWNVAARQDLLAIHWRSAARVDREVEHFAETGEGDLRQRPDDTSAPFRLHVAPFVVRLSFDRDAPVLRVWRVFRP